MLEEEVLLDDDDVVVVTVTWEREGWWELWVFLFVVVIFMTSVARGLMSVVRGRALKEVVVVRALAVRARSRASSCSRARAALWAAEEL